MAIAFRKDLQNSHHSRPKPWCINNSRELQGICLQKSDQRHKSLILINTYIHPSTASTCNRSWDFLEEIEDQLVDTIVMCGDFNATSSKQGNNPQGNALDETLGDVMFNQVTTLLPTRLGS